MATFGLVHGAYRGGWCWERLTPELESRGHRTLTVDLPNEDPDAGHSPFVSEPGALAAVLDEISKVTEP